MHALPVALSNNENVYATTTIKVVYGHNFVILYGRLIVEVPKYLYVDREAKMVITFDRSACYNTVRVVATIVGKVDTVSGEKEFTLGTVTLDLSCTTSGHQVKTLNIVVPRTLYDESVDKVMTIYVKRVEVLYSYPLTSTCSITSSIPAKVFLVTSVPEPRAIIKGLSNGILFAVGRD